MLPMPATIRVRILFSEFPLSTANIPLIKRLSEHREMVNDMDRRIALLYTPQ